MAQAVFNKQIWKYVTNISYYIPTFWSAFTPAAGTITDIVLVMSPVLSDLQLVQYGGVDCSLIRNDPSGVVKWQLWNLTNPPQGAQNIYLQVSGTEYRNVSGWVIAFTDSAGVSTSTYGALDSDSVLLAQVPYHWTNYLNELPGSSSLVISEVIMNLYQSRTLTPDETFIGWDTFYGDTPAVNHRFYLSSKNANGSPTMDWTITFSSSNQTYFARMFEVKGSPIVLPPRKIHFASIP